MQKRLKIIFLAVLIVISVVIVIIINNYEITLMLNNYDTNNIIVLLDDVDNNGNRIQIIKTKNNSQDTILKLTKNSIGIWNIDYSKSCEANGLTDIFWSKFVGVRFFDFNNSSEIEHEWHYIVVGNNAIAPIQFKDEEIPPFIAVNIQQSGAEFIIHFISYANIEKQYEIQNIIPEILIENNLIK